MKTILAMIMLLTFARLSYADQPQQLIDVQHDSVRGVTCWILNNTGISCLPDSSLQPSTPTSTTTDETQAPQASLAKVEGENAQFPTSPLPAQKGFQL